MVLKVVTNIDHFSLQGIDDYILSHGFGLSKNKGIKKEYFSDKLFVDEIGKLHNATLNSDAYFACAIVKIPDPQALLAKEVDDIKEYLNGFIFCLWFVRDNSISTSCVFTDAVDDGRHSFMICSAGQPVSNSQGTYENVDFTKEDLEYTQSVFARYKELCRQSARDNASHEEVASDDSLISLPQPARCSEDSRLERAIRFLHAARTVDCLPYRISLYLPIFESLFGCGVVDASGQRVTERVAKYAGKDMSERVHIFNTIREAARLRSGYISGGVIENDPVTTLWHMELSKNIDDIARKVLLRIIMEDAHIFSQDNVGLDTFFNALMLG